ncbi:NAD(P)/FAD-dependent oxidoreductase [Gracilimonas sp.]|uniref:NAD(P)/FAD-dependent oxidoreductase n=1 Tax=Gracilimonas sp. TaxID=1974203 RepID=UPI0032EF5A4C
MNLLKQNSTPSNKLQLIGRAHSQKSYELRDFLKRSVVNFEWIEINNDEEAKKFAGISSISDRLLPICIFPDGTRLYTPSLREVADRLGWISKPKYEEYDVSIYGAGPAGLSAAVYAASEGLKTIVIERNAVGGQAGSSSLIENFLGFPSGISGADLAERARQQAVKFGCEILLLREGVHAEFIDGKIHADLADGGKIIAKTNICATGVEYQRLNIANEDKFLGAGIFYGSGASEAPMCSGQTVFVIGGGNSAGQAAMNMSEYASKVVMLVRGDSLSSTLSHYLIEKIENTSNIKVLTNTELVEVDGDKTLKEITILNNNDDSTEIFNASRIFICIGGKPHTEWAKETKIIRNEKNYLITGTQLLKDENFTKIWPLDREPYFLETSVPGSFAAGDVRHGSIKRVASAVGEGAMAVTFIHKYLQEAY